MGNNIKKRLTKSTIDVPIHWKDFGGCIEPLKTIISLRIDTPQVHVKCHTNCNKCGSSCRLAVVIYLVASPYCHTKRCNWWAILFPGSQIVIPKRSHT